MPRWLVSVRSALRPRSGPVVARWFHRLLALTFFVAFVSLGVQVMVLIGHRGLLPIEPLIERLRHQPDAGFSELPTLFWLDASDGAVRSQIWIGGLLALTALFGVRTRLCLLLATLVYLSYTVACRSFLSFQWDNLILECGLLAAFLPANRRAGWIHLLFRLLAFKLYFESGIAKWQSHLGDWQDGSAMTFYYETAPIPTRLAWYAHNLPEWWHHFESRLTLVLELGVPLLFFGPRAGRLAAAATLTGFQLVNIATANYGFFAYLAIMLHVFLLDDRDLIHAVGFVRARLRRLRARAVARGGARVRRRFARGRLFLRNLRRIRHTLNRNPRLTSIKRARKPIRTTVAVVVSTIWIVLSVSIGIERFWPRPRSDEEPDLWNTTFGFLPRTNEMVLVEGLREFFDPFRIVNAYHLFGHITRERYEPEFQTFDGTSYTAHDFYFKAGDPSRPPPFVAPHQPRVDFLLWFYGLGVRFRDGAALPPPTPEYVGSLLTRMCTDPAAIQSLFSGPLPKKPEAVRIVFYDYRFTTPEQKKTTGDYWRRTELTTTRTFPCAAVR